MALRRLLLVAILLAMTAAPLIARPAPGAILADGDPRPVNPLEGHTVALELPTLSLEIQGETARGAWQGPTYLLVDGRRAVRMTLPEPAEIQLPRRPWSWRDWLAAGGIGAAAAILGAVAGALAVLVH